MDAALLDPWGRVHRLEIETSVGRACAGRGLAILHASVSRRHAVLARSSDGAWTITDLGSSNASRINEVIASDRSVLASGDRVSFGQVSFYFVIDHGALVDADHDHVSSRTPPPISPELAANMWPSMTGNLPSIPIRFVAAPSGGGGYIDLRGHQCRLTDTQFAMLLTLAQRMADQTRIAAVVRGFVPSGQLIASLPWGTPAPTESHLKQLVRRTRKVLTAIDAGDLIESRRGFGYRLRAIPILEVEDRGS